MENRIKIEREHFDRLAKEHNTPWWGSETPAGIERSRLRAAKSINYIGNNAKQILEIGCSKGYFTKDLASVQSNLDKITAIDLSPELVAIARKWIVDQKVEFRVQNVERMDFPDNCFDAIVGNAVLHHLDLPAVLPEMKRVLKVHGKIFFAEPNMLNPLVYLEKNVRFIGKLLQDSPGETAFIRWKIKKTLEENGFNNVETVPFDFVFPLTPAGMIKYIRRLSSVLENVPLIKEISGSLIIKAEINKK